MFRTTIIRLSAQSIFIAALLSTAGCASVLNPYSSEFTCPKTDNGKCVSLDTAYEDSVAKTGQKNSSVKPKCESGECVDKGSPVSDPVNKAPNSNSEYQSEMQKKIIGLLKDPITPIVAPPTVMRVLMLPYKGDDNELFMMRYVYIFVDNPRWVFGDYLNGKDLSPE